MQKYVELETLELKEKYTDVICKEVASFLSLQKKKVIERIGSKRDGSWIVIK